jgi:transcriptional regulator with XRE-family HTH domain
MAQPVATTSTTPAARGSSFGELLRDWRQRRRLTQLELSADTGVSTRHLSFLETGRSQPSRAMVLVLADQDSYDDLFCGRALCGEAGQNLHGVLDAIGVARDYLILRVLPVDTLGVPPAVVRAAVDHPQVRALHGEVLVRVRAANPQLKVLLTLGPHALRLRRQGRRPGVCPHRPDAGAFLRH